MPHVWKDVANLNSYTDNGSGNFYKYFGNSLVVITIYIYTFGPSNFTPRNAPHIHKKIYIENKNIYTSIIHHTKHWQQPKSPLTVG